MESYDVTCPVCGCVNHSLYLEETDGWMECERCKSVTRTVAKDNLVSIPVVQFRSRALKMAANQN